MLLKVLEAHVKEFPKLTLGESATRATRFLQWRTQVRIQLGPVGHHMKAWWEWCESAAQKAHKVFLNTIVHGREGIVPSDLMPRVWEQMDAWMRPRLVEACPHDVKEWVNLRTRQNQYDDTHVILFYLYKQFAPGGAEEKMLIGQSSRNPQVCSNPKSAQVELIK